MWDIFTFQWQDMDLPAGPFRSMLLASGALEGTCAANGKASGPPPPPPGQAAICNKPGPSGYWWDRNVDESRVAEHVGHGCLAGTCAQNGKPTGP